MQDMNAKVGCERDLTVGPSGLGERKEHGDHLIRVLQDKPIATNTWFKMHPRRLYTWKSLNNDVKNQIHCILVPECFRNAVWKVKTYPGADCFTDHNLL